MLSNEEKDFIINYKDNLIKKIDSLRLESDEVLKRYNYTKEQISAIRNFDGSDEILRMASSNCEVYGGFNNFTSNSSGSSTQMVAAFRWKGKYSEGNSFASKDIFAVTWSSPFIERSSRGYLSYVNTHYGDTVDTTATVNADDLYLSSIQVIKNESTVVNGDVRGHWIDAGSIISELSTKTKTPDIVAYALMD